MIIDSHQHLMIPASLQIQKLKQAGADKAILFSTAPHPEKAESLEELKKEMNTLNNILAGENSKVANRNRLKKNIEELVGRIREYPDCFFGFGPVPLGMDCKEIASWIEKYILGNNLKGIGEFTPASDEQMYQMNEIFKVLSDFKRLPVWVHTFNPVGISGIHILMDLCRKYPNVPVIFGHLGGSSWMEVIDFAKRNKQVYLDLSAAFASIATKTAIGELPERCLYSSDAPYGEPYLYRQLIEFVSPSREIAEMVLGNNIIRLINC